MGFEGGTQVFRAAALGADPGEKEDRVRHQGAQALEQIRAGGAGHGSDRGEAARADRLAAELVDDPRELVVKRGFLRLVLYLCGTRGGCPDGDEAAGVACLGGGEKRPRGGGG